MRSVFSVVHTSSEVHTVAWRRAEARADWCPGSPPGCSQEGSPAWTLRVDPALGLRGEPCPAIQCSRSRLQLGRSEWILDFETVLDRSGKELWCPLPAALAGLYQDSSVLLSAQVAFLYLDVSVGCFFGWNREQPHWRLFRLEGSNGDRSIRQACALWLSGLSESPIQIYAFAENRRPLPSLPMEVLEWKGFHPLHLGAVRAWSDLGLKNENLRSTRPAIVRRVGIASVALLLAATFWVAAYSKTGSGENEAVVHLRNGWLPDRITQLLQQADREQGAIHQRRRQLDQVHTFAGWVETVEREWPEESTWRLSMEDPLYLKLERWAPVSMGQSNSDPDPERLDRAILDFETWLETEGKGADISFSSEWQGNRGLLLSASIGSPQFKPAEVSDQFSPPRSFGSAEPLDTLSHRDLRERIAAMREALRSSGIQLAGDPHFGWGSLLRHTQRSPSGLNADRAMVEQTESIVDLLAQAPGVFSVALEWKSDRGLGPRLALNVVLQRHQLTAFVHRVAVSNLGFVLDQLDARPESVGRIRIQSEWLWAPLFGQVSQSSLAGTFGLNLPDWNRSQRQLSAEPSPPPSPELIAKVRHPGLLAFRGAIEDPAGRPAYILQNVGNNEWLTLVEGLQCEATGVLAVLPQNPLDAHRGKGVNLYWPTTGRQTWIDEKSEPVRVAHAQVRLEDGEEVVWICGETKTVNGFDLTWHSNAAIANSDGRFVSMKRSQP